MECGDSDAALVGRLMLRAEKLAREEGCAERGARFVINCKADGQQTVPHLHVHVLGKRQMRWPPG
jgi:histidine triad (HIT) family protein